MNIATLGIDIGIIVGIVGLSEWLKALDKTDRFKKFYIVFPVLFSIVAAFLTSKFEVAIISRNVFAYIGASTLGYKAILKKIRNEKSA